MSLPLISIIVPVYNAEKYIEECLLSITQQTLDSIEIICINDGSTDDSIRIINNLASADNRIRVISQENMGVSAARNHALKIARAPYIMFVDSDDALSLNACKVAYSTMMKTGSDVVIYCCALERNGNSTPKCVFGEQSRIFNCDECFKVLYRRCFGLLAEELDKVEQQDYLSSVCFKLYKRSIIVKENIRFVDIREIGSYEDGFFNLQYLGLAEKAAYIPDILYHYRRDNEESNTSRYKECLSEQWMVLFNYMQNEIDCNRLPSTFSEALSNRRALSIIGLGLNILLCKGSFLDKVKLVKNILSDENYRTAVEKLQLGKMAPHWKMFFIFAKYNCALAVTALLRIMDYLRHTSVKKY